MSLKLLLFGPGLKESYRVPRLEAVDPGHGAIENVVGYEAPAMDLKSINMKSRTIQTGDLVEIAIERHLEKTLIASVISASRTSCTRPGTAP
ncbi:MAG: hypothetical protein ACREC9_02720 [Methylocella sp.]